MAISSSYGQHHASEQPSSFEKQDSIKEPFAEAQRDDVNAELEDIFAGEASSGSEMVREESLSHDMRPPPEIAAEQDRQTFNERLDAERNAVNADLEASFAMEDNNRQYDRGRDDDLSL